MSGAGSVGAVTVAVRAPASSANLGPGFDCAGLCLALYHELTVHQQPGEGLEVHLQDGLRCLLLGVPQNLTAVAAIPDFTLETRRARQVLPRTVPLDDAVCNQAHLAMLVVAMSTGDLSLLREAMVDRLHQPYRRSLVPSFDAVCGAAIEAVALGAALSGSGPTVLALTEGRLPAVGQAMVEAWGHVGVRSRAMPLSIDPEGLQVQLTKEELRS